jgi:hypothetical protein
MFMKKENIEKMRTEGKLESNVQGFEACGEGNVVSNLLHAHFGQGILSGYVHHQYFHVGNQSKFRWNLIA